MMAFIDDHHAVVFAPFLDLGIAIQRLHNRNVNDAAWA